MTNLEWLMQDKDRVRKAISGNPCFLYDFKCEDTKVKCIDCKEEWLDAEHEEPDTQEKIDADSIKDYCDYFGHKSTDCKNCKAYGDGLPTCAISMTVNLLKRQREFDARK